MNEETYLHHLQHSGELSTTRSWSQLFIQITEMSAHPNFNSMLITWGDYEISVRKLNTSSPSQEGGNPWNGILATPGS